MRLASYNDGIEFLPPEQGSPHLSPMQALEIKNFKDF